MFKRTEESDVERFDIDPSSGQPHPEVNDWANILFCCQRAVARDAKPVDEVVEVCAEGFLA
jgi:hypothetical protein